MDLRIEKTYRSLLSSFICLMKESRYERISVAMLCDKAMIRRTTFYKHFADKDEFFVFFAKSMCDEFEQKIIDSEACDSPAAYEVQMFQAFVDFLMDNRELVDNILGSSSAGILLDLLSDVLARDIAQHLTLRCNDLPAPANVLGNLYAGGLVRMVRNWWAEGCSEEGRAWMMKALAVALPIE